jgi:hypothetical protein
LGLFLALPGWQYVLGARFGSPGRARLLASQSANNGGFITGVLKTFIKSEKTVNRSSRRETFSEGESG